MCTESVELHGIESDLSRLRDMAIKEGVTLAKLIGTRDLVFDSRSRSMGRSCGRYGKKATCPHLSYPKYRARAILLKTPRYDD